jgi:hypothetical protein
VSDSKSTRILGIVGLGLLAFVARLEAAPIKPVLRCGSPIDRKEVKVVDVSDLDDAKAASFIEEQIGKIEVVKQTTVQTRNAVGRAWKKAEHEAAEMGCPFVVVLSSGRVNTGGAVVVNPTGPIPIVAPVRRNEANVLIAKPAAAATEPAANGPTTDAPPIVASSRELPSVGMSIAAGLTASISGKVLYGSGSAQVGWLAVVTNSSDRALEVPSIGFFLVDADGVPLQEGRVEAFELEAGETRSIRGIERIAGGSPSKVAAIALRNGS